MNQNEFERAKKMYWIFWTVSLISAFLTIIYLLMFSWRIYGILALMSLTFGAFSLSRIVEYISLSKIYKDNDAEFTVPRLFQKKNKVINPNNIKGRLIWFFSTVPFIVLSLFLAIFDIILLYI